MPQVRIELFGAFRVNVAGGVVPEAVWQRRKPAALIKLLALAPGRRLHREQILDALWPELDPLAAGANLRKALHHARRALDGGEHDAGVIGSNADLVWLAKDAWIDVDAFRLEIATARRSGDVVHYRRAVALYGDGLLPEDRYMSWADGPREELHLEFLAGLGELARLLETQGEVAAAIDVVRLLVAANPLDEDGHASLIRLYALAGRRGDAMRAYDRLCEVLRSELGVEPSAGTKRLYEEIRARESLEPELSADLWERVGDLRMRSGDGAGAAKAFQTALHGVDSSTSVRLERKCADAWLMQHRPQAAASHLAVANAHPGDPAERARVLRANAHLAWETGDIAAAEGYAEQARDAAVAYGTPDDVAAAYEALAVVSHYKGEWRAGLASALERLTRDGDGGVRLPAVFDIHHCIGQYHLYGDGLFESVETYARNLLDRAEEAGAARAQAFAWCLLGESLLLHARFDEAAGCLARSCELHGGLGSRSGALAWQRRAELAVCAGVVDQADGYLEQAAAIATVSPMSCHLWGRIHATQAFAAVERGQVHNAMRSVRAAAASAARYGDCPTCSALLNPIAAEAFALVGDADGARGFAESAAHVSAMFTSSAWQAMAASAAGSAARAGGDVTGAQALFDAAQSLYERSGQPYWAQRSTRLVSFALV